MRVGPSVDLMHRPVSAVNRPFAEAPGRGALGNPQDED